MMTTEEAFAIVRSALSDIPAIVRLWAAAKANGTLHELSSFQAYMALDEVFPKNQTTDDSATAHALNRMMREQIEQPAMRLWRATSVSPALSAA